MDEIWKTYPNNQDYEVSNLGRVRSKPRWVKAGAYGGKRFVAQKILKSHLTKGYEQLIFNKWSNEKKKDISIHKLVHRMVAETWIPNPDNKAQVNHINGQKDDNRVENLEWVTMQENLNHARYELNVCKLVSLKQINELYNSNPNMPLAEFVERVAELRR